MTGIKIIKLIDQLPEGSFRNFLLSRKKQVKVIEEISKNCFTVDSYQNEHSISDLINELKNHFQIPENLIIYFNLISIFA